MKKPFFILFCLGLLLASCSEYQQVLRSEDYAQKLVFADSLYQLGKTPKKNGKLRKNKLKKSLTVMEQIVPVYRGKPQAQKLMFNYAHTFYLLEDYYLGGYQFERFVTSYPKSDSVEIAAFRSAKSYYHLSPRFSLDQKDTYRGLEKLQEFVNRYPNSTYRPEANELVVELREKLEKKDFETAMQYLRIVDYIGNYRTAIEAFDNFITDHPGSIHRKDAFYKRLEAGYLRAMKGVPSKKQERLITAKEYYQSFLKYYKDSDLREDADEILAKINAEMEVTETTS